MAKADGARRFHFLREIASGGFGSVYLAKLMHADGFSRLAAVKLLHRRWSENEEIAQRMRDEARLLGWLRHRNIVDVVDLTSIDGRAAIIMEYLEAVDLKVIVHELTAQGERMPVRVALEVIGFVASALDAAYNRPPVAGEKPLRVIHRDIKPSNIMVDDAGLVKVLDFGVARAEFDARESHTRDLQFGSVDYMPPERLFFEPETPASDVYSLGSTLYELLTLEKLGKARGRPERHAALVADRMSYLRALLALPGPLAKELDDLLSCSLNYEQDARPSSADVTTRARALARGIGGPTLSEWAEIHVPPTLQKVREIPRRPNPMTDTILSEDSLGFSRAEAETLDQEGPDPFVQARPEATLVADDDPRWAALRAAAVAELDTTPAVPSSAELPPDPSLFAPPAEQELEAPAPEPEPKPAKPEPLLIHPDKPPPPRPVLEPLATPQAGALDAISAPFLKKHKSPQGFPGDPRPRVEAPVAADDDWDDLPTRIATREDQQKAIERVRDIESGAHAGPFGEPAATSSPFAAPPELAELPGMDEDDEDEPTQQISSQDLLGGETRILDGSHGAEDDGFVTTDRGQAVSGWPAPAPVPAAPTLFPGDDALDFDEDQPTQMIPEGDATQILSEQPSPDATQILADQDQGLPWDSGSNEVVDDLRPTERGPGPRAGGHTLIPDMFEDPPPPAPAPAPAPAPPAPSVENFFDDPDHTQPPPPRDPFGGAAASPAPPAAYTPDDFAPVDNVVVPKGRSKLFLAVAGLAGMAAAVLIMVVVGGQVSDQLGGGDTPTGTTPAPVEPPPAPDATAADPPPPAPTQEAVPVPPPEPEPEPEPSGPTITFVSQAAETKKVRADCTSDGARVSDRDVQAVLAIAKADKCTVTAYLKKGRRSATVTDVTQGTWVCFSTDDDSCKKSRN